MKANELIIIKRPPYIKVQSDLGMLYMKQNGDDYLVISTERLFVYTMKGVPLQYKIATEGEVTEALSSVINKLQELIQL